MVHNAYVGVARGGGVVTRITYADRDADRMVTTVSRGTGVPRGHGGKIATIILAGMETTLDEVQYMLEGIKEKKFVPQRKPSDIAQMCRMVAERRNDRIKYLRKNPSEAPPLKPKTLYLPVGYRMVDTPIPGFRITARV